MSDNVKKAIEKRETEKKRATSAQRAAATRSANREKEEAKPE